MQYMRLGYGLGYDSFRLGDEGIEEGSGSAGGKLS